MHMEDEALKAVFNSLGFVSGSPAMVPVLRRAYNAASVSDLTVLLEGETGTGKRVLAQAIHALDQKRKQYPFITVSCGCVPEALAESEFFGHERGAFSGAVSDRRGLFQNAHRGTLFLDDVNDLTLNLQVKLLDFLQRRALRPVGSDREVELDVRIIAAANQPLRPLVLEGRFRADLHYRLDVVRLVLSPLRERSLDLPCLILALARRYKHVYAPIDRVEPDLVRFLESQAFPGNVRELENVVQRMLFLKSQGTALELEDWLSQAEEQPRGTQEDPLDKAAQGLLQVIREGGIPLAHAIRRVEEKVLEAALQSRNRTAREAAALLGTSERTLYRKLRSYYRRHHPSL